MREKIVPFEGPVIPDKLFKLTRTFEERIARACALPEWALRRPDRRGTTAIEVMLIQGIGTGDRENDG